MDDPHLRAPSAACQKLGEVEHQSGRADDKSVFPEMQDTQLPDIELLHFSLSLFVFGNSFDVINVILLLTTNLHYLLTP